MLLEPDLGVIKSLGDHILSAPGSVLWSIALLADADNIDLKVNISVLLFKNGHTIFGLCWRVETHDNLILLGVEFCLGLILDRWWRGPVHVVGAVKGHL